METAESDRLQIASKLTLAEKTAISQAFSGGNYANAYESTDLGDFDLDEMPEPDRVAFVLGFFASYELDEIGSDREMHDECYWSETGRYVVAVGYIDDRASAYADEASAF